MDPAGDTGAFLITTYESAALANAVNAALRAEGIVTSPQGMSNIVMTDWGLHLYISSLVERRSVDGNGFPWRLGENAASGQRYGKGTCPNCRQPVRAEHHHVFMSFPSCLTAEDEDDIIRAFEKVLAHFCHPAKSAQAE